MSTTQFHSENTIPSGNWIWVFACDESGRHAKGKARIARVNFRAEFGVAGGPTGHAYAIPVYNRQMRLLPTSAIEQSIAQFLLYAQSHPDLNFFVNRIACGPGELSDDWIGPLFARPSPNCSLPDDWRLYVTQARSQPLTQLPTETEFAVLEHTRCPFCGHWTLPAQIEAPSDFCRHDVFKHG
jgi:hypothetical protein